MDTKAKKLYGQIAVEPVTKDEVLAAITGGKPFEGSNPLQEAMEGNGVFIMHDKGSGVLEHDTKVEGQATANNRARKR